MLADTTVKRFLRSEVKTIHTQSEKNIKLPRLWDAGLIHQFMLPLYGDSLNHKEYFYVLLLNRGCRLLGWHLVSIGGVCGTSADPKIIFQTALVANATTIVLAHNHPSGNLRPSEQDRTLTKKLQEGGKLLEINVIDHVISSDDGYYSFADNCEM